MAGWLPWASAAPRGALATGRMQVCGARRRPWLWGAGTCLGSRAGRFSDSWELGVAFALE